MSIILDPNKSFISIETYYIEEKKKHGNVVFHFIRSKQELEKWKSQGYEIKEPGKSYANPEKLIEKLITFWRRMTWKDQNVIFSKSLRQMQNQDGKLVPELDMIKYRDLKLKSCLKKWDLIDDSKEIPISEEIIDNLDPSVASELLNSFEAITEATEDEKKS